MALRRLFVQTKVTEQTDHGRVGIFFLSVFYFKRRRQLDEGQVYGIGNYSEENDVANLEAIKHSNELSPTEVPSNKRNLFERETKTGWKCTA